MGHWTFNVVPLDTSDMLIGKVCVCVCVCVSVCVCVCVCVCVHIRILEAPSVQLKMEWCVHLRMQDTPARDC